MWLDANAGQLNKSLAGEKVTIAFTDTRSSIDEMIVEGDTGVLRWTWEGTHTVAGDSRYRQAGALLWLQRLSVSGRQDRGTVGIR